MAFNISLFAAAAFRVLHIGRAWALTQRAARAAAQHHDPISTPAHGPLLSMMVAVR